MKKRILSVLLTLGLVVGSMPMSAFVAAESKGYGIYIAGNEITPNIEPATKPKLGRMTLIATP